MHDVAVPHTPTHRRGATRAALLTAAAALALVTVTQVIGAARFAERALSGDATSWIPALVILLGGGLSAALTIVAVQAVGTDLRTRPRRTRQDASREQQHSLEHPDDPGSTENTDGPDAASGPRIPHQRDARRPSPGRPRGRGGVHRAGPG